MSEDSKQKAWLEHYQRLLNVEFDWDTDHLSYQPPVEGPPIPITTDMVISQIKAGKALGPSGIVVMIRAASDIGASMIRDLAVAIIRDGKVPSDWEQSFIVCLYKGKGDTLERGNYCGLKLTQQVMKTLERIVESLIRQLVSINNSQFGFVPGRGITDTIFVVRQLQEKYSTAQVVFQNPLSPTPCKLVGLIFKPLWIFLIPHSNSHRDGFFVHPVSAKFPPQNHPLTCRTPRWTKVYPGELAMKD